MGKTRKVDQQALAKAMQGAKTARQVKAEQEASSLDVLKLAAQNPLLKDLRLTGFEDDMTRRLIIAHHLMGKAGQTTLKPLLPLLLQLKGKPYHLQDHFPFEPFFRTRVPRGVVFKCARQVAKSTSLASQGVLFSNCIPYFSTLYIAPLFEQIRRFSQNFVRPFIETSPVHKLFSGTSTINSVLQKSFKNHSQMVFSFAFLDAERTRGISADKNVVDEIQGIDKSFLPIIHETMSASEEWGLTQYTGTPLTLDNTIERLWQDSSMAEWVTKCRTGGCGHWNIPAMEFDLVPMIGKNTDVSEETPGVVCAKCQKPIFPREGRWLHRSPEKRWEFAGYHVPQTIMPMHYRSPEKWQTLLGKKAGRGNTPVHVFFNEVCGESFDSGSKLVNLTDLKRAACLPWSNRLVEALERIGEYIYRVVAVDWGGGGLKIIGKKETTLSFTVMAAMGMRPDGSIDVLWGHRSLTPHERVNEAKRIIGSAVKFKSSHVAHDYTGAGADRETIMVQAGFPYERVLPMALAPSTSGFLLRYVAPTALNPRGHWQINKSRSLQITCQMIKSGKLRFFSYDHHGSDDPGLINDFLALTEETTPGRNRGDVYLIHSDPQRSDDFAQAVNIGSMALCALSGKWPDLARAEHVRLSQADYKEINPAEVRDWEDI